MSISARSWSSRTCETVIAAARTRSRSSASSPGRLDVDDDVALRERAMHGRLDAVGGGMPLPHRGPRRDADDDVRERAPAGLTQAKAAARRPAARAGRSPRARRPTASAGARSISTSTLRRISRTAATTTSKATKSAAIESPSGNPARAASRPPTTATVPSEVGAEVDCVREQRRARVAPRGAVRDERARDVDRDDDDRRARTPTRRARHRARSSPPAARPRAPATTSETRIRNAASASAARCSALPCP